MVCFVLYNRIVTVLVGLLLFCLPPTMSSICWTSGIVILDNVISSHMHFRASDSLEFKSDILRWETGLRRKSGGLMHIGCHNQYSNTHLSSGIRITNHLYLYMHEAWKMISVHPMLCSLFISNLINVEPKCIAMISLSNFFFSFPPQALKYGVQVHI